MGNFKITHMLLEAGADIESSDSLGPTALERAALRGRIDMVRFLLNAGAKISRDNIKYRNALFQARDGGHMALVRYLRRFILAVRGADDYMNENWIRSRNTSLWEIEYKSLPRTHVY